MDFRLRKKIIENPYKELSKIEVLEKLITPCIGNEKDSLFGIM